MLIYFKIHSFFASICLISISIFLSSCSYDDEIVNNTGSNPPPNDTNYGAFVINDGYYNVFDKCLGYYSFNEGTYNYNIYKNGYLPDYSREIIYDDGSLYITSSDNGLTGNSRVLKISAWGEDQGKLLMNQTKDHKVNKIFNFNGLFGLTYFYGYYFNTGTFETFHRDHFELINLFSNVNTFITDAAYIGDDIFLLNSVYNNNQNSESSLYKISPPDTAIQKINLSGKPAAIKIHNNKLIVASENGTSDFYYIDPAALQKTDSVTYNERFLKTLVNDKNSIYLFYLSADNKIMKFNPVSKIQTLFLNNPLVSENYSIANFNIDPYSGNVFVLFRKNNMVDPGKLQIYDPAGYLLATFITAANPSDLVFARQ